MTITRDELRALVIDALGTEAEASGAVLSVSLSALRPGRFYMMGLNPGGSPNTPLSIAQSLQRPGHPEGWCSHTHDCWKCDERPRCKHLDPDGRVAAGHLKRHQQHVLEIYQTLGVQPGVVLATNAVFARSTGTDTLLGAWGWWEKCWPVHQRMLAEVRPEWIVTLGKGYGTTAFGFLMDKAKLMDETKVRRRDVRPLGNNDDSDGRMFSGKLELASGEHLSVKVLGLPHPSWYGIDDGLRAAIGTELGLEV